MDTGLNEHQQMLLSSAGAFLRQESPRTFVRQMEKDERGFTLELWRKIAELGWLGLIVPEEYGGIGQGFLDLGLLMEEVGRHLLPGPFFDTALTSAILLEAANEEQKKEFLPMLASGDLIGTVAILEPYSKLAPEGIQTQAVADGDSFALNGTKVFVPYAHTADYLVTCARTGDGAEDITVFLVDARADGVKVDRLQTVGSDFQCEVALNSVSVPAANVLGRVNEGWPIVWSAIKKGATLRSAQMSGAMQEILDMTVEYLKNRMAFGRPIGTFQALQHYAANMAMDADGSRYITYQALWSLDENLASELEVAAAKAWVSDAGLRVAGYAHQSHGAIGFTEDYDLQLFTRRLKAWETSFGNAQYHRDRIAELAI